MTFHLSEKQEDAQRIISGPAKHILLEGGSRSGKTFLHVRNTLMRALKAPGSRHAILRFRFNHVKQSIVLDTLPKVLSLAFPGVESHLNKTDYVLEIGDGSQVFFGGLDDKERTEKILGMEFVTILLNEVSQIPYASVQMVTTRLAQRVDQVLPGRPAKQLKPRMFYDWNPSTKAHWAYQLFHLGMDPETGRALANPQDYTRFKINPEDNRENISDDYLSTLAGMGARMRRRFLDGEAAEATPNALFDDVTIEKWRHTHGDLPDMVRVVVAVDPSGSGDVDNADNDAIGIVVVGLGTDGNAYVFEDATVKAGPATWGSVAVQCFDRHEADVLVGEVNYGGAMVDYVIQTQRPRTNFKMVTASRGKTVRAEPFSALYEHGKVRHVGYFREMEEELCAFSTAGYTGAKSPNRADALIWALTELFAGIVKEKKLPPKGGAEVGGRTSFMAN